MFYSDKPIMSKDYDELNRVTFTSQIVKSILSYEETDNLVISLCGTWGVRKNYNE